MTLPSRSADRDPRRGNWFARLFRSPKAEPRSEPAPRADHGLWTVDRVVRVMATACERENRTVPVAHAVVVGRDTVWFHLKTPDEQPPSGWTADHDARTWHAPLRWLQSASVADSLAEPYPRLVSLGSTSKGFALLNLSHAGGIIALEGDSRQASSLVRDWTRELTTSPWSRGVRVVRIGFKPGTADPVGTSETQTLVEAEAALADTEGGVLMLSGLPGGRDRERVHRLADDPEGRWSVIVIGRVDRPRWRFTIDPTGIMDTGLLDGPVAHTLNSASDAPVHEDAKAGGSAAVTARRRPDRRRMLLLSLAAVAVLAVLGVIADFSLTGTTPHPSAVRPPAHTASAGSSTAAKPGQATAQQHAVSATAAGGSGSRSTDDGTSCVPPTTGSGAITDYFACASSGTVTLQATFHKSQPFHHVFFDTDGDTATGYQLPSPSPSTLGADYMIENGVLYRSLSTSWKWTEVATKPTTTGSGSTYTWKLPLSAIGSPTGTQQVECNAGTDYTPVITFSPN